MAFFDPRPYRLRATRPEFLQQIKKMQAELDGYDRIRITFDPPYGLPSSDKRYLSINVKKIMKIVSQQFLHKAATPDVLAQIKRQVQCALRLWADHDFSENFDQQLHQSFRQDLEPTIVPIILDYQKRDCASKDTYIQHKVRREAKPGQQEFPWNKPRYNK